LEPALGMGTRKAGSKPALRHRSNHSRMRPAEGELQIGNCKFEISSFP
jgi:hypothetical protein